MKRYRYFIITMIVIMTMINYIDRGAISYAQEDIIKEFGFDTIAWGSILGYFGYGLHVWFIVVELLPIKRDLNLFWILAGTAWSLVEIAMAFAGELGMAIFGVQPLLDLVYFECFSVFQKVLSFQRLVKLMRTGRHLENVVCYQLLVLVAYL